MEEHTFYVQGMHCKSCVILTEEELQELPEVTNVKADLATLSVKVQGNFDERSEPEIAELLTKPISEYGYTITVEKEAPTKVAWNDFLTALPIALAAIFLFVALQKLGIVNLVQAGDVTYGTAFLVGIIASLSTCMAVVGGLVLSMSATFNKTNSGYLPQILFHLGRLISFYIFGGVIGAIGSRFQLSPELTFGLGIAVGLVLLILGINLLDIFPWANRLQPTMPKALSKHLLRFKSLNSTITPALIGAITFFLPCGFTQSMQIYTLTTGSFAVGGLTMLVFALGTLPVLALLSFSSVGLKKPCTRSIFFKAVGVIIIFFAIFNILTSLSAIGLIDPLISL